MAENSKIEVKGGPPLPPSMILPFPHVYYEAKETVQAQALSAFPSGVSFEGVGLEKGREMREEANRERTRLGNNILHTLLFLS